MEKSLVENTAPHSVQIVQNAKGEFAFEVKVYAADEKDAADRAIEVALSLRQRLASRGVA
jgi:hypothetical protein